MRATPIPLLLSLAACSVVDATSATTAVGGLVVATPAIAITGQVELPAEVVASEWVSERDSAVDTNLTPVDDATASVVIDDAPVTLRFTSNGRYTVTSREDASLVYQPGSTYTFIAVNNGVQRGGTLDAAPERLIPAAVTLEPRPTAAHPSVPEALLHPANTALSLTFGAQYGRYGYVLVLRADPNAPGEPTVVFDSRPETAAEVLDLIVGDDQRTVEVPATAFATNGIYAVLVFAVERGTDLLPNTFIGSAILVGSSVAIAIGVDS